METLLETTKEADFMDYLTLEERYEGMASDLIRFADSHDKQYVGSSERVVVHFFEKKVEVILEFHHFDPYMNLDLIKTEKSVRGKGYASMVMQIIADLADKWGVNMELDADPLDAEGLTESELIRFYQKFGFRIVDENDDSGYGFEFMRRIAKTP
jgi:GNAT superfamily N-acetyltransferase